jgi:hypothetical protein
MRVQFVQRIATKAKVPAVEDDRLAVRVELDGRVALAQRLLLAERELLGDCPLGQPPPEERGAARDGGGRSGERGRLARRTRRGFDRWGFDRWGVDRWGVDRWGDDGAGDSAIAGAREAAAGPEPLPVVVVERGASAA